MFFFVKKKRLLIYLFILILVVVSINSKWLWRLFYPLPYWEFIELYADRYELDPLFVAAVIKVESGFQPRAESERGAKGLMQLMPDTARWIAQQTGSEFRNDYLYNPDYNIRLGCWYLANLRKEFDNNEMLVLAAYNGGRGNVRRWMESHNVSGELKSIENIPFPETKEFVKRVLKTYHIYHELYGKESSSEKE